MKADATARVHCQGSGAPLWCAQSCPKSRFLRGDLGHGLMHGDYMHIQGQWSILIRVLFKFTGIKVSGMVGVGRSTCRSRVTTTLSSHREQVGLIDDTFQIIRKTSIIGRSNSIKIQIIGSRAEKDLKTGNSSSSFSGRVNRQAVPYSGQRGRKRNMRLVLFDIQMIFKKRQMQLMKKAGRKCHQD